MKVLLLMLIVALTLPALAGRSSDAGLVVSGTVAPSADVHVNYDGSVKRWSVRHSANLPGVAVRVDQKNGLSIVRIFAP